MADRCPHLEYREAAGNLAFDVPRAYCTVAERFVQPMRADVCNERYDLSPPEHCEIYRDHEGIADPFLAAESDGGDDAESGDDGRDHDVGSGDGSGSSDDDPDGGTESSDGSPAGPETSGEAPDAGPRDPGDDRSGGADR